MGRKIERVLEVRHRVEKKTHKLAEGKTKEYVYDQYFLSLYVHVPKSWVEEGYKSFRLIAVDKAHSFIIVPENVSENELKELRKKIKNMLKSMKAKKK